MVNRLFASELKDVKTVRFLDVIFEENIIYITMKYNSYVFDEETKYIAKYDVLTGIGNITDKKNNIKEYTSLKRLYNACIKLASSYNDNFLGIDYKKLESYKNKEEIDSFNC